MAIKKSEKTCRTSNKISHVACKTNVKLGAVLKLGHQVAPSYRYRIVKIDIQIGAIEFAPIRNWGKSQVGAQHIRQYYYPTDKIRGYPRISADHPRRSGSNIVPAILGYG